MSNLKGFWLVQNIMIKGYKLVRKDRIGPQGEGMEEMKES